MQISLIVLEKVYLWANRSPMDQHVAANPRVLSSILTLDIVANLWLSDLLVQITVDELCTYDRFWHSCRGVWEFSRFSPLQDVNAVHFLSGGSPPPLSDRAMGNNAYTFLFRASSLKRTPLNNKYFQLLMSYRLVLL